MDTSSLNSPHTSEFDDAESGMIIPMEFLLLDVLTFFEKKKKISYLQQ